MLWLTLASAGEYIVPGDYSTLSSACTFAEDGSTILVEDYPLQDLYCSVQAKHLTIQGANPTVKIDPIHVTNGSVLVEDVIIASQGASGSVVGDQSGIELNNVTLTYENAHGIYLYNGSTLSSDQGLVISDFGGTQVGILVISSASQQTNVELNNCKLENNRNSAISITGGQQSVDVQLKDCTFSGNGHGYPNSGGAVHAQDGNVALTIEGGTYANNSASAQGGAVRVVGDLTLTGATFRKNSAGDGSAVWHQKGALSISGTLFVENTAFGTNAGALYSGNASSFGILGAQFALNQSSAAGAGPPALAGHDLPQGAIVQYSRFCGSQHTADPGGTDHVGAAGFTGQNGLLFIRNVVDSNPGHEGGVTVAMGGSSDTWVVEHNTFAGNGDLRATLGVAGGELQAVNNLFDSNPAGIGLYGQSITFNEQKNAFRDTDRPADWSNSLLIDDPAYLDYTVGAENCEQFPDISASSPLVNQGSVDTIANNTDDPGRPDIGATFAADADPGDTEDPVDTALDSSPDSRLGDDTDAVGYRLGPATGGCQTVPAPLWLGLLALLARRSRC